MIRHVKDPVLLDLLVKNNFMHEHADSMYSDFERLAEGYGETGDDRTERVTFVVETQSWFPSTVHIDAGGHDWYNECGPIYKELSEAIAWLNANALKAPKQK